MASHINLLPWREWERERLKNEFLVRVGLVFVLGVIMVYGAGLYVDAQTSGQQDRNQFLKDQIAEKDLRIRQIRDLRTKRQQLLARMQAIQELQGNRPIIVRVFDEVVRTLANGVYYSSLTLQGTRLQVAGTAESNNRISALMRNLDTSEWFANPNLQAITENAGFGPQASDFEMTFARVEPKALDLEGGSP